MALTVEDGTIVSGANSYVSDSDYTTYAAARGYTIGSDASAREIELIKAMDYLESYRDEFKGLKVSGSQPLQWPRYSVWLDTYQLDSNFIPQELKNAQMEAARLISSGIDLVPNGSIENIQSESIGELSVSYFSGGKWSVVQHKNIDQFLDCLLIRQGGFASVRV